MTLILLSTFGLMGKNTLTYIKALPKAIKMIRQAQIGSETQQSGNWWVHTTEEFGATLNEAGFRVEGLEACYRSYADRAFCFNDRK